MKAINSTRTAITQRGNNSPDYFSRTMIALLLVMGLATFSFAQGPTNGIWESYGIISINGASNTYYDLNAESPNPDFNGSSLGYFWPENSIVVIGGQNKTNKCNGGDITNGFLHWRVWLTANGPAGTFNVEPMSWVMDLGGTCGGDQLWQGIGGSANIISSLPQSGQYTLEMYTSADGYPGTVYSNNSGTNYKATFIYCSRPNVTLSVTACDSYTWTTGNGQTYTSNGNYPYTVSTPLGCDSTTTLHLQINFSTKSSMTDQACDSYLWSGVHGDGKVYTASGTYYNITTNAAGCPDTNVLILTIDSATNQTLNVAACGSYLWASPEGDDKTYTTSGTYTHTSTNSYGCTHTATLNLVFRTVKPATPGLITGIATACPNESNSYSVVADLNTDAYVWGPPAGATILSGQGTNSVVVRFGPGFVAPAILSVKATNCKGSSASRTFTVKPGVKPATPGTISGPTDVCPYVFSGTNAVYTINKVDRATSFNWTLSDVVNSHIISHAGTGADDVSITVHFDPGFTTGTIGVSATGNCGTSNKKSLTVTKKVPVTPTITGNINPCPNATEVYTASDVTASGYVWTIGTNNVATIVSGQGTPVLTLRFKDVFVRATISVKTSSVCGASAPGSLVVDKNGFCRMGKSVAQQQPEGLMDLSIFPNPSNGIFTIAVNGANTRGNAVIDITNAFGQTVLSRTVQNSNGIISFRVGDRLTEGMYMMTCSINGQRVTKRLVINR